MKFKYAVFSLMILSLCIVSVFAININCDMYDSNYEDINEEPTTTIVYKSECIRDDKLENIKDSTEDYTEVIEYIQYYTEDDVRVATEILYNEARGVESVTNIANVVWCILNRYDNGEFGDTIQEVMISPHQFAYTGKDYSSKDEFDYLYSIATDVFYRWNLEKNGVEEVGRTLPSDYMWFSGNGEYNVFRDSYDSKNATRFTLCTWLVSPYES